ncbi:MAG: hypothetical protein ACJ75E_17955 [Actinomycetes bacterium]
MGGEPPVQLPDPAGGLGGSPGPLPGAAAGPVAALGVEAAGAAGPVLTVEPSLEPAELSGLVVQLGAEGLLPGAGVGDDGDAGGADVQADQALAGLVAPQRGAVQEELGGVGPAAVDPGPHDPAGPQPAFTNLPGGPPLVATALVEREPEHQAVAPLQPGAVGRDAQRALEVLAGQAVQPVALALEPWPATLAEHPTVDRLVGPFAEHLGFLGEDVLA